MTEFRVGDVVRRTGRTLTEHKIRVGDTYRVEWVRSGVLSVEGASGTWDPHYFELVHRPSSLEWDPSQHLSPSRYTFSALTLAAWMHFCFLAPTFRWTLEPIKPETVMIELPYDVATWLARHYTAANGYGPKSATVGDASRAALEALEGR